QIADAGGKTAAPAHDFEAGIIADRPVMEELQRRYLQLVLEESGGNRRRAAQVLGLDRRTIQRLIARYQLSFVPEETSSESGDPDASVLLDGETDDDSNPL